MPITSVLPSFVSCGLVFAGWVSAAAAAEKVAADNDEDKPRVAYPSPFSRPPSQGKQYDTWKGATGPDIGVTPVDVARLPSRVDNSKRPEYPVIYKQKWGTCGQHASIASIFTYEMNVLNGTKADTDATRFPAYFSWNMINSAKDGGSEAYHGWEVAKRVGIPTSQTYGGTRPEKIGHWPNGYHIWWDAMRYRVSGYRYSPVNSVDQLNEARGWLYDRNNPTADKPAIGGIFAMDGRMGELDKVTVKIPPGEYAAGEDIWTRWGPTGYGHGLTCVGYDDQVGHDLNGDGKITNDLDLNQDGKVTLADWERGAFIVVNSWGDKWSGDGRIYLLYSAMVDPTWKRGNFLGRAEVARHIPRLTLRLKLSCDDRTDLRMRIGFSDDPAATAPDRELAPEVFNGWPLFRGSNAGHVPLAGPGDPTPIEVGVDVTPLLKDLGPAALGKGRVFLSLGRADGSKAVGELHECAVRFYDAKGAFIHEDKLPLKDGKFGPSGLSVDAVLNPGKT